MTIYDFFLTIGLLVTMVTVYLLYCRQLQIIKNYAPCTQQPLWNPN
jgi:hypothetical protein